MQKPSKVLNVSTQIMKWIHDSLMDRKQKVSIKGKLSYELPVTSGVPQESVLGPSLFPDYINDLLDHVDCYISLFADDTLIYQVVNNAQDQFRFQYNVYTLQQWANMWCMSFNVDKCSVLPFNQTPPSLTTTMC